MAPRGSRERASLRVQGPISSKSGTRGPVLRLVALCALLCALAGCRFEVTPVSFDLSADVGQSITESLGVRNTGDDPVELTLATSGAAVTLSTTAGVLQAGEALDIEISAECSSPGERRTDISVTGRTGNKAITVRVPFALRCYAEDGARFVSLEVFQGPPIYKKDYRAGTETDPVTMFRPENGAAPVAEWTEDRYVSYGEEVLRHSLAHAWRAESEGFVTAIWGRRAAVAVVVSHTDDSPLPDLVAEIEASDGVRTALPVLLEETESEGDRFLSAVVFSMDRALYARGATLHVAIASNEGGTSESLALFGETVEPLQVTWIPIALEGIPDLEIDPDYYMDGLDGQLPIADRVTGVGPTMAYERTGEEGSGRIYLRAVVKQLAEHHALHACGNDEIYFGMWNNQAVFDTDPGGSAPAGLTNGQVVVGTPPVSAISPVPASRVRWAMMLNTHEVGHVFELGHTASCGEAFFDGKFYPYENGQVGPARSWEFLDNKFISRDAIYEPSNQHYSDFMACDGRWFVSDFSYQLMTLQRQSSSAVRTCASPPRSGQKSPAVFLTGKSSPVATEAPASIALAGSVSPDGIASISMAEPTANPAWTPRSAGNLTLEVIDSGGSVLHREPIAAAEPRHGGGEALWSARVPYFEDASAALLRGSSMEVLTEFDLRADASAESAR